MATDEWVLDASQPLRPHQRPIIHTLKNLQRAPLLDTVVDHEDPRLSHMDPVGPEFFVGWPVLYDQPPRARLDVVGRHEADVLQRLDERRRLVRERHGKQRALLSTALVEGRPQAPGRDHGLRRPPERGVLRRTERSAARELAAVLGGGRVPQEVAEVACCLIGARDHDHEDGQRGQAAHQPEGPFAARAARRGRRPAAPAREGPPVLRFAGRRANNRAAAFFARSRPASNRAFVSLRSDAARSRASRMLCKSSRCRRRVAEASSSSAFTRASAWSCDRRRRHPCGDPGLLRFNGSESKDDAGLGRVASLDVTTGGFVRGFSGGHSFAGGAVGGLCDLEGGGEMRRARSSKEGRGEPARGLPEDGFEPSAVARGPTGVQTSDGASCDSLARRSSSLFSRGSSVMELSELSSSSRDPDVTGARCARCVGGRAPGGVVRGMGGGGRRGFRRCSAAWMAARAVGDRFSSTGGRGAFCGVGRRLATSCSSSVRDIMSGSRSRTIFSRFRLRSRQCCDSLRSRLALGDEFQ